MSPPVRGGGIIIKNVKAGILLTLDDEFSGGSLIAEHRLDFTLVGRFRHVDCQPMREVLDKHLVLGTGDHLRAGHVPRDRHLLVTDDAFEDGVLALDHLDVFQRLRELELFANPVMKRRV